MIVLEKPYVSDFLIDTIQKNNFYVLETPFSKELLPNNCLIKEQDAIQLKNELFYSNSENSIDWILKNYPKEEICKYIKLCKNKILFREALKSIYPNFYFKKISLSEIEQIDSSELIFPIIIKPSVGFLSFGVYPIKNKFEWENTISKLKQENEKHKGIFPDEVVNFDEFIIEEIIAGDEYALDAYFNENGEAIILNIFKHPFFDDNDVSDRIYYTSKEIINNNLDNFKEILNKIGKCCNFKNFPFHIELRVDKNSIIPIEINPLRFCGWCITDIAHFAWGINVYEYYLNKLSPDWSKILSKADNSYYYFTMADIPSNIQKEKIKNINYENYLKNIKNPIEIRKINPKQNPVFAIIFAKTNSIDEIKNILKLNMENFIDF